MNIKIRSLFTVLVATSLSTLCQKAMADTTWSGASGVGGSASWSTSSNWSNAVPSATSSGYFQSAFSNQPVLSASSTALGLWVSGATHTTGVSGLTTISGGFQLTLTGTGSLNGNANTAILLDGAGNNNLTITAKSTGNVNISMGNDTNIIVNNSGTLTIGDGTGAINGAGKLTFGGTNSAGSVIINARIITARLVTVDTEGSVTFNPGPSAYIYGGTSGPNTGIGLTLNKGTLNTNTASSFGSGGTAFINGGRIDNTSGSAITLTGSNIVAINGDFEFVGGGVGTSHDITINTSGTNSLVSANAAVILGGSGTRTITTTASNSNLTIVDSIISGSSSALRKAGAGKLTLSGSNTYTGKTVVSAGTLVLSGSGSINSSSGVSAASGATFDYSAKVAGYTVNNLEGAGTFLGTSGQALTLASTGTLSAGDGAVGTLVISAGDLSLASGAKFAMEIGGTTLSPTNDTVSLTGSGSIVNLAGSYTLLLSNVGTADPTGLSFTLFDSVASIASAGSWTIDYGTTGWSGGSVSLSGGNVVLSGLSAVPEPGTWGLLGLGALAIAWRARKRA